MLTRIQRLIPFVVALIWGIDIHAQELISDIDTRKAGFTNINQACFTCGNLAYFTVNNEKGYELWRTDGSTEGTFRITDLNPGDASGVPGQFLPSCLNTTLFFAGDDGSGRQLWKTDGTIIGTSKVSTQSPIVDLHSYSDNIVFSTENQLWISNGSEEASLIIEFEKGLSRPSYLYCGEKYIYFSAINSVTNERELWRSDGTQFGTIFLKSIGLYAIGFEINGTMIFSGMDENGAEIWISDGSPEGTLLLDDIVPGELGSNPFFLGIFNDNVVFSAQGDIWLTVTQIHLR